MLQRGSDVSVNEPIGYAQRLGGVVMGLANTIVALDTECRRLPGSNDYQLLSVAVVGSGGALLHMPYARWA